MADPVSLAASCVQPLCECLNATGVSAAAGREVGSFAQLKSNRRSLGKAVEGLRPVETTVRARVAAEINMLNVCDPQVQAWLNNVDGLQLDAIGEEYDQLMQSSCLCQFTTNAARRRRLGKRLVETLDEVKRLAEEGGQFKTFGIEPPPEFVERQPQIKTFGMERMLGQLHDLFDKAESNIIGVWGQGGVGKTTLLHVFNNDLEAKAGDYQVVILIEVSNSEALNTVDIQQTISDRLNLPWNEAETVDRRAKFLVKALARKRYVVLLDDVRKKFRLEDVGIPTPDAKSKSKLILTSRYQEVCYHMGAQRSLIEMQVLDKDAAWDLFLSKLSTEALKAVESPDVHNAVRQHAMAITQICGGLPLALNVIGMAVAGLEEPREWLSALNAIKANMVDIDGVDEMFARLKYSFDRLTLTQQQCFLYCTLFPEYGSISKEQLVDYWLAEGFLLENCDRGRQIIQSLISACLLQASSSMSSKVKMHHIIRRLGLWLVNKAQEKFIVQAGMALESTPSLREWKEATRVSIMSNKIMGLSFSPKCRKLTTLLVQNNQELNKLSSGFFKYMSSLRVLDLSNTAITSLPECDALVALQHLNLSHTHIMRLPERLWLLKELRHLDLSVTFALEDTFDNCSKLHKLRVLNLFRSHYGIRDVDDLNLDSLKELLFLGITIYAEDVLRKLNKTHPLAKSTHRLNLKYCADMRTIKVSELNHMVHLEELYVESCYDLNTLVADAELMSSSSCLQILTLSVLPSLEYVTVAPMPHHFQNIRKLTISNCPKLLNVTWVLRLELLERLVISHSDEMLQVVEEEANGVQHDKIQYRLSEEQIIHSMVEEACNDWENGYQNMHKSEGENGTTRNCFPRLRSIVLTDLKKLTSICQPRDFHCLETIRVEDCPILRCIPLSRTYKCAKLKQICGSFVWWGGLQWEDKETQTSMENKYFIPI